VPLRESYHSGYPLKTSHRLFTGVKGNAFLLCRLLQSAFVMVYTCNFTPRIAPSGSRGIDTRLFYLPSPGGQGLP
jgi:hypothetical protein